MLLGPAPVIHWEYAAAAAVDMVQAQLGWANFDDVLLLLVAVVAMWLISVDVVAAAAAAGAS